MTTPVAATPCPFVPGGTALLVTDEPRWPAAHTFVRVVGVEPARRERGLPRRLRVTVAYYGRPRVFVASPRHSFLGSEEPSSFDVLYPVSALARLRAEGRVR